mgnify:CR=1 FL=1
MNTNTDFGETDPLAPRGDEVVSPPIWIGGVVGLSSGIFAVSTGLVVSALGNSQSSFDLVGSSFIDRTPRWLKELAIQAFGTNDKIALEVGMVGVLIVASGVLGLLSRKRLTPLQFGIVGFGILGALSAFERDGAGFIAVYASRVSEEARQLSDALAATELVLAREQHLTQLDGLAAAAAHELGTPLATITLVVKELGKVVRPDDPMAEDIALLHGGHVAIEQMKIRAADGSRCYANDGVGRGEDNRVGNVIDAHIVLSVPAEGSHNNSVCMVAWVGIRNASIRWAIGAMNLARRTSKGRIRRNVGT